MPNPTHIAIIHSHFEPGEVTDVVCNHVESLRSSDKQSIEKIVLLSGNRVSGLNHPTFDHAETIQIRELGDETRDESLPPQPVAALKAFRRVDTGQASLTGRKLFERVDAALRRAGLHPENSILHWHNHSLGKNAALPFVVSHLATTGWRLLLQIHDLDADHAPENIQHLLTETGARRASTLDAIRYPVHENIAYVSPIPSEENSPAPYAIMTTYVTAISAIVRTPPGNRASREAVVEEVLTTNL